MARTSFDLEANIRTNGTEQINQLSDSIRMSAEEARKFQELGDWTNATQEIQNIEAMKNSLAQLTQEQMNSQRTRPGDYSERARQIGETQDNRSGFSARAAEIHNRDERTKQFLSQYGLDSKKGIEAAQQNYRREEIMRLYERLGVLNDTIDDLSERIEESKERNDIAGESRLLGARNSASEEKNALEAKLNRLLNEEKNSDNNKNGLSKYFGLKELGNVFKFAGDMAQAHYTYRQDIANGNVVGAERRESTSRWGAAANLATSMGTALMLVPGAQAVGGVIAGVGMLGGLINNIREGSGKAGDAEAQAYMNNFDAKYGALRSFRDVSGNESENTKAANEIFSKLTAASMGTGLDTAEISRLVQEAAKQGVSENRAYEMATNAGKWNQETGADINTMLRLQGMAERYGLGQDVISTAYGGLKASGMQKAQLDEFLNGLQSVIEDGISNGYLKSTDEVAAQMTMFATLSGNNPLWTGQNAVNNIKQMNAGLSAAADMNNTAQIVAMDAARSVVKKYSNPNDKENYLTDEEFKEKFGFERTNSYHDYEMALKNPIGEVYGAVLSNYRKISGGNETAEREWIKQGLGVDIFAAAQLQKMTGGDFNTDNYKNVIDNDKITPDASTEQISWSDSMKKLSESLNRISEGEWQKNIAELNKTVQEYLGKGRELSTKEMLENAREDELSQTAGELRKDIYDVKGRSVNGVKISDLDVYEKLVNMPESPNKSKIFEAMTIQTRQDNGAYDGLNELATAIYGLSQVKGSVTEMSVEQLAAAIATALDGASLTIQ